MLAISEVAFWVGVRNLTQFLFQGLREWEPDSTCFIFCHQRRDLYMMLMWMCVSRDVLSVLFIYLFIVRERERERVQETYLLSHAPDANSSWNSLTDVSIQECNAHLPCECQGPSYLSHRWLFTVVYVLAGSWNRELGSLLKPRFSDMGHACTSSLATWLVAQHWSTRNAFSKKLFIDLCFSEKKCVHIYSSISLLWLPQLFLQVFKCLPHHRPSKQSASYVNSRCS